MLSIGDGDPAESESESCRVSSTLLLSTPESLRKGDSGSRAIGRFFFDLVSSIFGGRKRFETGKGDNGGVDCFSMSWILTKGCWENQNPYKVSLT